MSDNQSTQRRFVPGTRTQKGLTLLELMVVLLIFLLILVGVVAGVVMFVVSRCDAAETPHISNLDGPRQLV